MQLLWVDTTQKIEIVNLSSRLVELTQGIEEGIVYLWLPHTTAAILLAEDDEELRQDFIRLASRWLEPLGPFAHRKQGNPNAEAHILSALAGVGVLVPVVEGRPALGKYQNVLLLEMDGPKRREVRCLVLR